VSIDTEVQADQVYRMAMVEMARRAYLAEHLYLPGSRRTRRLAKKRTARVLAWWFRAGEPDTNPR
jgi:hypothetical protein